MSRNSSYAFTRIAFIALTIFASGTADSLLAEATILDVIKIEEHWELHVGGPDEAVCAPQVTMVMSPTPTIDDDYFTFTLNHWSDPEFAAGGAQAQQWCGDECVAATSSHCQCTLYHEGEVITWVQCLSMEEGTLTFQITDGSSQSWGSFGADGEMILTTPTTLTRLNDYLPGVSITNSGISYAGNRVSSLVLQRLRWTTADGQEHELVAPIDIDSDLDP